MNMIDGFGISSGLTLNHEVSPLTECQVFTWALMVANTEADGWPRPRPPRDVACFASNFASQLLQEPSQDASILFPGLDHERMRSLQVGHAPSVLDLSLMNMARIP